MLSFKALLGSICIALIGVGFFSSLAIATQVDLTTFGPIDPSDPVTESSGTVTIEEDPNLSAVYFLNDYYMVPSNGSIFSFDYDFQLGPEDEWDYLVFEVDFVEELFVNTSGTGHFKIDLTAYQITEVSIAWGLIWDGDNFSGSKVTISNIEITTQSTSVPEPSSFVLFGLGVLGIAKVGKKVSVKRS